MSIGSLGVIGSVISGPLQQARGADSDRAIQDRQAHDRSAESARLAEAAAGVGEMTADEQSSDRDADGRRLWEQPDGKSAPPATGDPESPEAPQGRDPTGQSGGHLDLTG